VKRAGFLIEKIADTDNLHLAFYKSRKGKEHSKDVIDFRKNFSENIKKLRNEILSENLNIGNYHYFKVFDPKERTICAASFPERILHHAIMNVCHPYFEKFQIEDSFATRIGKGQYAALERAKFNTKKYKYFCKLDCRKYFDNISHDILFDKLKRLFKDQGLLNVFEKIIDSYSVTENRGVPIGNLTSQYFANFYLAFADRFAKQTLHIKGYVRYMDDMVLWGDDKTELLKTAKKFGDFLSNELNLPQKPLVLNESKCGLSFLGYVLFPNVVRLNKNSKKRFVRKCKNCISNLTKGEWSQEEFAAHTKPLFAFAQFAETFNFRKRMIEKTDICRWALTA